MPRLRSVRVDATADAFFDRVTISKLLIRD
jgi:hypothetical protein